MVDIIREKDKKLRQGLAVMGMSHRAYWTSWFITSVLINLMITIITIGMGLAFGYPFFRATPVPYNLFSIILNLQFFIVSLFSCSFCSDKLYKQ